MAVINTNIAATMTTNALSRNDRDMAATMERLSTGKSINSAKDDAAGLAVSSRMTCLLYTSPSPRDLSTSRMPSSA